MAVLKDNKFERICSVRRAICSFIHLLAACCTARDVVDSALQEHAPDRCAPSSYLALHTLISLHDTGFKQFWRDLVGSLCSSRLSQLQQLNTRYYT